MSNQKNLLDFVNDPKNLDKAIEGSMEKRQAIIDQANTLTIEQRLDEILNTHLQDFKAGHDDKFRDSFLQLLSEARIDELATLLNEANLDESAYRDVADRIAQLTPKEDK